MTNKCAVISFENLDLTWQKWSIFYWLVDFVRSACAKLSLGAAATTISGAMEILGKKYHCFFEKFEKMSQIRTQQHVKRKKTKIVLTVSEKSRMSNKKNIREWSIYHGRRPRLIGPNVLTSTLLSLQNYQMALIQAKSQEHGSCQHWTTPQQVRLRNVLFH